MQAAGVKQPASGSSRVWAVESGEIRKPGIIHIVMLALFTGIGIVVGTFGSLAIPIGFVSAFWPGQAVQAVGGVWFGGWGVIAGALFPFISNSISGSAPLPLTFSYLPANIVQGLLAAWAFRAFKANPALLSGRDWIVWVVFGVLLANLIGSLWGSYMLVVFGLATPEGWLPLWGGWFVGNSLPSLILGSLLLKYVSPLVMKSKSFVKGWWA